TFKGENALMKAIVTLREGKSPVVYFTQGNGEYDLNNRGFERRGDPGLGVLAEKLRKNNYEVKELKLGPGETMPSDADVVAVVRQGGQGLQLPDHTVKALQDYMSGADKGKKGKLLLLADAVVHGDGKWVETGLEGLLSQYGVRLGKERLLALNSRGSPTDLP